MAPTLHTVDGDLRRGTICDRPNRFVLSVEFAPGIEESVYISNTGSWNVTKPGRTVLARPVEDESRKTDADAVFVRADGVWVSVDATFANAAFETALGRDLLPAFEGYERVRAEPPLPSGGRADFELVTPGGDRALVEVKSCTLVEDGVATFPDRPTERGRRHVRELIELREAGTDTHLVFVVQRSDGDGFRPNAAVDPKLADLVSAAVESGVGVHAIQLGIEPPAIVLESASMPVEGAVPSDR